MGLVRLAAYDKEVMAPETSFWVDPREVTTIHLSGVPGCSTVHARGHVCGIVLGTPDDVTEILFPGHQAGQAGMVESKLVGVGAPLDSPPAAPGEGV